MAAPRGSEVWRDFVANGIPSSGANKPKKSEIRAWASWLESLVTSGVLSSGPWFATKAAMTLTYAANTIAIVYNDPTAANNGLYIKTGASGSGAWTQLTSFLPGYQFVTASATGASTANAIVASTSPRLPAGDGVALVTLAIPTTNTASPVTVRFDGGTVLTIKTRTGEDPDAGELQQNDVVAGFVSGSTFRLISDLNSLRNAQSAKAWANNEEDTPVPTTLGGDGVTTFSAKHWATKSGEDADRSEEEADRSEVARAGSESARDQAAGYVNDIVSEKEVPIFSTIAGMSAIDVDLGMTRIRVDGRNSDIDGEGGLFSTTDTGSADTFVSADGRTWYRVNDDRDVAYLRLTNKKLLARAHYALTNALAFSLVCQGDSMTYGHDTTSGDVLPPPEGHTETRAPIQYPSRLATQLAGMTAAGVTVLNRGYSGDTAKVSYQRWPTRPNVHVVIISLGINDSGGLHGATFSEYQLYMERLVQRYIRWGIGVVIMTPTEIQHNNSQRAHADFGRYAAALGEAYGCPVIHAAEATSNCVAGEIYSDTIHFNKVGYAKLGDYVASAILAGVLSGNDRAVSSETFVHSVAGTPAVGFVHKGSIAPITTENAYIETDTALGIFDGARVTFAFYLDAEAADIFVAGDVTGAYFACSEPVDGKGTARTQIKGLRQSLVRETGVYQAQARLTGRKFYAGTFVGRGWKKFSITGPIGTNSTFLNGVWIVPKGEDEAGSQLAGYAPCKSDSFTHRVPDDGGGLLPAASINGDVVMPLPKALWVNASSADIFHATGVVHVTLIARGTPGNVNIGTRYLELVRYDGSNNLNVRSKDGSHETVPMPIAAGVGYTLPDQGPELLNKTRYPSQNENGWLYLTFADEVDGYYTFEVNGLAPHGASASLL